MRSRLGEALRGQATPGAARSLVALGLRAVRVRASASLRPPSAHQGVIGSTSARWVQSKVVGDSPRRSLLRRNKSGFDINQKKAVYLKRLETVHK